MLTVEKMQVKGLRVLVRVDFNVPLKGGVIRDDNRIVAALPTIKELMKKGARIILFSHLGKVRHKEAPEIIEEDKKKNDLAPIAIRLSELLSAPVKFVPFTRGEELNKAVAELAEEKFPQCKIPL